MADSVARYGDIGYQNWLVGDLNMTFIFSHIYGDIIGISLEYHGDIVMHSENHSQNIMGILGNQWEYHGNIMKYSGWWSGT